VNFHSYTRRILQHTERSRLIRTVIIAERFDDEDSGIKSKKDNNDHDDKNDDVSRRLPITNVRRIDKVGYGAIRRSGRGYIPVVDVRVHVVRSSSRRATS
jgi:hypothetical protein